MPTDILLAANGDLQFTDGDIGYGESTGQHQRDIVKAKKGHYKHSNGTGVGIDSYLKDDDVEDAQRSIRKEFIKDGMDVSEVSLTGKSIFVKATYGN